MSEFRLREFYVLRRRAADLQRLLLANMLATTSMHPSAAKARLKRLLAIPGPRRFEWYHIVGGLVPQCLPSSPKHGDYFALLEELVDSFDSGASSRESRMTTLRGVLDTSKAFHQAYWAAEVRALESPPAGSHRLTWNHLRLLVRVPAADRERIQREAIQGRWPSARLLHELRQRYGRKNPGGWRVAIRQILLSRTPTRPVAGLFTETAPLPRGAARGLASVAVGPRNGCLCDWMDGWLADRRRCQMLARWVG